MTKRLIQSWYILGKNIDYNFTSIVQIRKSIKTLKYNIQYYADYIAELESCFKLKKELKDLNSKVELLYNSIDDEKQNQFLSFWKIVGRSGYGLCYQAFGNCREQINELLKAEFKILSKQSQLEIIELESKILEIQDLITLTKLESGPIIRQYQDMIVTEQTKIIQLKLEYDIEVIKIKQHLQST